MRSASRRAIPHAVYHVTTETAWREIQASGVLQKGKGYGWEERKGVFAVGWQNWLTTRSLHYLPFLTLKLKGKKAGMVVLKIAMTPELIAKTQVALLSSIDCPAAAAALAKARSGRFSNIDANGVVLLPTMGSTIIRNTFPLKEFVREVPPSAEPLEYIIDSDVALACVTKACEIARSDIPVNILTAGKRLARRMKYRTARNHKSSTRKVKSPITQADRDLFVKRLLASA